MTCNLIDPSYIRIILPMSFLNCMEIVTIPLPKNFYKICNREFSTMCQHAWYNRAAALNSMFHFPIVFSFSFKSHFRKNLLLITGLQIDDLNWFHIKMKQINKISKLESVDSHTLDSGFASVGWEPEWKRRRVKSSL
jgi:hypothetical protein